MQTGRSIARAGNRLRNRTAANEIAYDILSKPFYLKDPGVDIYVVPMRRPGWAHHEVVKELVTILNPHRTAPFAVAYAQFPMQMNADSFFDLSEGISKLDRADLTRPIAMRSHLSGRHRMLLNSLPSVFSDALQHGQNPLATFAESGRIFFPLQLATAYPRPYRFCVGLHRQTLDTAGRLALALQFGVTDGPDAAEHLAKVASLMQENLSEITQDVLGTASTPTFYTLWLRSEELLSRMYEYAPIATHFLHVLPAKAAVARLVGQLRGKSRIWKLKEDDVLWRNGDGSEIRTGYHTPRNILPYLPNYEPGGKSRRVCPGRFAADGWREFESGNVVENASKRDERMEDMLDALYVRYPGCRSNRSVLLFTDPMAVPAVHSVLKDFERSGRVDFADESRFLRQLVGVKDVASERTLLLDRVKAAGEDGGESKSENVGEDASGNAADSSSSTTHADSEVEDESTMVPSAEECAIMAEPDAHLEGDAASVKRARGVLRFLYELPPATGNRVPPLTWRARARYAASYLRLCR